MSYLFAAFLVIWAGLFAYILYWQRQVRDLRAEVDALRQVANQERPQP
ncbi:MAG TPA: CcmD family protein [Chloroflexota bacterium]|jgi:CcmD family protein